jgi:hypothetical protein
MALLHLKTPHYYIEIIMGYPKRFPQSTNEGQIKPKVTPWSSDPQKAVATKNSPGTDRTPPLRDDSCEHDQLHLDSIELFF